MGAAARNLSLASLVAEWGEFGSWPTEMSAPEHLDADSVDAFRFVRRDPRAVPDATADAVAATPQTAALALL